MIIYDIKDLPNNWGLLKPNTYTFLKNEGWFKWDGGAWQKTSAPITEIGNSLINDNL